MIDARTIPFAALFLRVSLAFLFFAHLGAQAVRAAEIKVLTAGAMSSVVATLVPDFEKQTGHKVTIDNGTAGALGKRIADGEEFDVAIITPVASANRIALSAAALRASAPPVRASAIGLPFLLFLVTD